MLKGINFNSGLNNYGMAMEPAKGHGEKKIILCALDNFFSRDVPLRAPYTYDKWNL